jgi:hypothetical protein
MSLLMLLVAASVTSAAADITGAWCQTLLVKNGGGIPPTYIYERATADCPADKRLVISRKGLPGYDVQLVDGTLIVDQRERKGRQ